MEEKIKFGDWVEVDRRSNKIECPKCNKVIVNGKTVILTFNLGEAIVSFCEPCGRKFKELKNVIDEKYHEDLEEAYYIFIEDK